MENLKEGHAVEGSHELMASRSITDGSIPLSEAGVSRLIDLIMEREQISEQAAIDLLNDRLERGGAILQMQPRPEVKLYEAKEYQPLIFIGPGKPKSKNSKYKTSVAAQKRASRKNKNRR